MPLRHSRLESVLLESSRHVAVPPPYTGLAAVHLRNPVSLDAFAGSRAVIRVSPGLAADVRLNGTPWQPECLVSEH